MVAQDVCNTTSIPKMIAAKKCQGFQILPVSAFFVIGYGGSDRFFKKEFLNEALDKLKNSTVAHMWNKISIQFRIKTDEKVAYIELAKKFCPKVLSASEGYF